MLPSQLDKIFEIATDPRVTAFFGVCLGCYILRDVARVFLQLFASFRHLVKENTTTTNPDAES